MSELSLALTDDLAEEQRALATLGRTYFVYSRSEEERGKPNATDLLIKAEKNYIDSLDVCDKLVSLVPDKELLEMRSRLYLNLGLVYETKMELQSARVSMEKALNILRYIHVYFRGRNSIACSGKPIPIHS